MREHYEFNLHDDERKPGKVRRILKQTTAVALTAVMAGTLAVGGMNVLGHNSIVSAEEKQRAVLKTAVGTEESSDIQTTETGLSAETESSAVADLVEETLPSIVAISTLSIQEVQNYYGMFGFYGGTAPIQREVEGGGSGIIIGKNDTELLIVTNNHVIADTKTISISFADNETVEGKVKGYDETKDVAIVAVPLDDIKTSTLESIAIATIGSSDDARVGEQVLVIGNALGYGTSVTSGIISAKNRIFDASGRVTLDPDEDDLRNGQKLIQTDAAINGGNSGGAMINMKGEVIGIACAKDVSIAVEGVCYAIAISDVDEILEDLMNEETRETLPDDEHGILGITGMSISAEEVVKFGFPEGVYIAEVTEGGAADKAGIKDNCIITKFNGHKVSTIEKLISYVNTYRPGEEVEITYAISNGGVYEENTVTVTLGEQTEDYKASHNSSSEDEEEDDREDRSRKSDDDEDFDLDDDDDFDDDEDLDDDYDDDEFDPYGDSRDGRSREDIFDDWARGFYGGY